jgi:hypothetical protein
MGDKLLLIKFMGHWEDSFQTLYNFKCELENKYPGSIVEVDYERVGNRVFFSKIFMTLKPCIDGFLHGCRPYLGVDSTHLTSIFVISLLIFHSY